MDLYKDVAMKLKPHVPPELLEPFNVVEVLVSVQQVMTPLGFNPDIVDQETTGKPTVCARIECCNTTKLKVSQLYLMDLIECKKCSRCTQVYYCSRECQVADWSRHKPDCKKPSK
jgi:hypothetical protein